MSLYAIKNDRGEWYDWEDQTFWPKDACTFVAIGNHEDAERMATEKGGHIVELVEAPAKIVVSQEEAILLENLQQEILTGHTTRMTYEWISDLKDQGVTTDEIFKALDNGWEIRKEALYNVKVPFLARRWFIVNAGGELDSVCNQDLATRFTMTAINEYGLQDCERVEVTDDEQ